VPFLLSFILLGISVYIRLKLEESPVFAEMKAQGRGSKAPLTDSFARWGNGKIVLKALFGATAGQGVVWYCGPVLRALFPDDDAQGRLRDDLHPDRHLARPRGRHAGRIREPLR
jgi:hypothetical protein